MCYWVFNTRWIGAPSAIIVNSVLSNRRSSIARLLRLLFTFGTLSFRQVFFKNISNAFYFVFCHVISAVVSCILYGSRSCPVSCIFIYPSEVIHLLISAYYHHPSDVVTGSCIGLLTSHLVYHTFASETNSSLFQGRPPPTRLLSKFFMLWMPKLSFVYR